jgi:hypothetical protein
MNRREYSSEVARMVYDLLKELGVCQRCKADNAVEGKVLCGKCLKYWREYGKKKT